MDLRERPANGSARHPWELARFDFFARVLNDAGALSASSALDVGSGDAWFAAQLLARLPAHARMVCWDTGYDEQGAPFPAAHGADRISLVAARPTSRHGLITALDVLEHVQDDEPFLRQIVSENLDTGGYLLLSVPAWPALYTSHDQALLHYRRYRPSSGASLAHSAGLDILRSGGLFCGLLAPRVLRRAIELVTRPAPPARAPALQWSRGPVVTRAVRAVLSLDNAASLWASAHGRFLPGLSWWALCRKS